LSTNNRDVQNLVGMLQGGFASARFVFSDGTWLMIR
jgi:hypothetical protein